MALDTGRGDNMITEVLSAVRWLGPALTFSDDRTVPQNLSLSFTASNFKVCHSFQRLHALIVQNTMNSDIRDL